MAVSIQKKPGRSWLLTFQAMENIVNFLAEVNKLKKMKRTGFVWLEVKNPETIAQHCFRVAIMNWILAKKVFPLLDLEKIIKISLSHDLCEVYTGDMTPYWGLLPKDKEKRKEILKDWIRLPKPVKEKRAKEKFKKEKAGLDKLIKPLPSETKKEIMNYWLEYENLDSKEGRFTKQGDKIETLLQAHEYWGSDMDSPLKGWWEEVEDLIDHPVLLDFLNRIEEKFCKRNIKDNQELEFFLKIGKLKQMVRGGWLLRGVENGSTVAEDAFLLAIVIWLLGKRKKLNLEKMLKMALVYEICEVYAEDKTPYEKILPKDKRERKEILDKWPRFLESVKKKRFVEDYKEEKKSLNQLVSGLPENLRKEIICLWDDCKRRRTLEGNFVNQIYWVTMMMQALRYRIKDKSFPITGWVEQMKEFIDDPVALEFLNALYKKYPIG